MKKLVILFSLCVLTNLSMFPVYAEVASICKDGFRSITPELGQTCVPEAPSHVVALDMAIVELLLIAENPPAAISGVVLNSYITMHPELEETFTALLETLPDMGYPPNIEVVLNAKPDLIVGAHDFITGMLYPELNKATPTVLYAPMPGNWSERLTIAGEALGLTQLVEDSLTQYNERIEELKTLLGEDAAEIKISLVRTFPGQIGLVLSGTAGAAILDEVGLSRPESQAVDYDYVLESLNGRPELLISEETLDLANADIIFYFGDAADLIESPLWQALPAVQAGQAFEVGYYWWGDSLFSAHDMLDDLFKYVAQAEPSIPNPFAAGFE